MTGFGSKTICTTNQNYFILLKELAMENKDFSKKVILTMADFVIETGLSFSPFGNHIINN
jgi:hypothetical protein